MKPEPIFLGYIKAYNARDVDTLLSFFSENCLFENISGGRVTVRAHGKAELEPLATKSAAAFAFREQRVRTVTGSQQMLVAEIDFRGTLQADLTPELKAGAVLQLRGVSVFEFRDGRITRLSDYS